MLKILTYDFKDLFVYFRCMCICLHICLSIMCMAHAHGNMTNVSDLLELELKMIMDYHVGAGN